ncbi:MAG: hypothetical protein AAFW64_02875 [Pseudomonadota bacterium]
MARVELDLSKLMGFRILDGASDTMPGDGSGVLGNKIGDKLGEKTGSKTTGPSKAVLSLKMGMKDGVKDA